MKTSAARLESLNPQFFASLNQKIAALKASGSDIIRLDIGSPDLPPAPQIIEALHRSALKSDHHGYQSHNATEALRQAWADMYQQLYRVKLDPDLEIIPLLGSKEGIFHLTLAMVDPGDIVLIPDPGYLTYTQAALMAGGKPYYLPLFADSSFLPTLELIPKPVAQRAKLLWLNYPNNPTAATAPLEFFDTAVEFACKHNILLCHDAAYSQVTFDGYKAPSLLQIPGAEEVAIEFNTLSKSHNMAGWRVGAALGLAEALQALYRVKTNADSGHFLPVLEAATAALNGDQSWLTERNEIYRRRRDLVVSSLRKFSLTVESPQASLYIWAPIPPGWNSLDFTNTLLDQTGVSLTPGLVFGPHGDGYVRIALTETEQKINLAMQRITATGLWDSSR